MPTFRDKAIVLGRSTINEVDQIYTLFTEKHGKIVALAKSSKKIKSKLSGNLEPPALVDVLIAKGKIFDRLAGAEAISKFTQTREDLTKLSALNYFLEIIDKLYSEDQPEFKTYKLLEFCLTEIENNSKLDKKFVLVIIIWFKVKLLNILGISAEYNTSDVDEESRIFIKKIRQATDFSKFYSAPISVTRLRLWHQLINEMLFWDLNTQIKSESFLNKFLIESNE